MKILRFILFCVFSSRVITAIAQPSNDNCSGAMSLTVGTETCATLDNSTTQEPSGETYSSCVPVVNDRSVWFKFTATATSLTLQCYQNAYESVTNTRWCMSVYHTTTCFPNYASTGVGCACADDVGGTNDPSMILAMTTLVVGDQYLVQVTYKPGNSPAPDFCIKIATPAVTCGTCASSCGAACVKTIIPTQTQVKNSCTPYIPSIMVEGGQSSTQCFTFTANNAIMMAGYLLGNSNSTPACGNDYAYTWKLYNSSCSQIGSGSGTATAPGTMTGLTVGSSYTVCYTLSSSWVGNSAYCYVTTFYPYVYPNVSLPIELTSFTGVQTNVNITLNWSTASEENNDYFIVQRSVDGINFTDLTTIDGNGTSTIAHNYSYIDRTPQAGVAYYRLAQVDFGATYDPASTSDDDGSKIHYSPVIAVEYQTVQLFQFALNPDFANIHLLQESQSQVIVFDERGVIVFNTIVSGPTSIQVPTQDKKGIWFACLIQGNHREMMAAF